jgi:predicted  nucleic acid-binding Zn-ribbon protein
VLAEIRQLIDLQTTDGQLREFTVRIERLRAQQKQIKQRIAAETSQIERHREHLSELEHDSRMKNLEVDELDMNIRDYQQRLDHEIISFKEMEDLRAKIASERRRISAMEDEALVLMDTIAETRQALQQAETDCLAKVKQLRSQIGDIDKQTSEIQSTAEGLADERIRLCEQIPSYLIKQYDTLKARSAEPIALIRNGTCSGCKLKLSGSTIERVRGGTAIVNCEHCSRVLYVDEFAADA